MNKKCFMGGFYGILGCFEAFCTEQSGSIRHKNGQNFKIPPAWLQIEGYGLAEDVPLVPELLDEFLG